MIYVDFNPNTPIYPQLIGHLDLTPDISDFNKIQKYIYNNITGKKIKLRLLKIEVEPNEELEISGNLEKLVVFDWEDRLGPILENVEIERTGNKIPIYLNSPIIKDYKGEGIDTEIRYKIIYEQDGSPKKPQIENTVPIRIFKEQSQPPLIDNIENKKEMVTHNVDEVKENILTITVKSRASHYHSEASTGFLKVETNFSNLDNPFMFENGQNEIKISNLRYNEPQTFPLFINYQIYPNPLNDKELTFKIVLLDEKKNPIEDCLPQELSLIIKPDPRITALGLEIKSSDRTLYELKDQKSQNFEIILDYPILWSPPLQPDQHKYFNLVKFIFSNKARAKHPSGKIIIKDLKYKLEVEEGTRLSFVKPEKTLDDLLDRKGKNIGIIRNGEKPHNMELRLATHLIGWDSDDKLYFKLNLKFVYDIEQQEIDNIVQNIEFNMDLKFMLRRNITHWLAIDFGTSAIAVAFARGDISRNIQDYMLNLRKSHLYNIFRRELQSEGKLENMSEEEIEKEIYHRFEQKKNILDEENTVYLPSKMLFHIEQDSPSTNGKYYKLHKDILLVAPPNDEKLRTNINAILPPLKLLIGYDELPDANALYMIPTDGKVNEYKIKPVSIDLILTKAYEYLLRDVIVPAIKERLADENKAIKDLQYKMVNNLGKLVITVPNTFTVRQQHVLRKMLHEKITWGKLGIFPSEAKKNKEPIFKDDFICFVNESDAVACYYIFNWNSLLHTAFDPQNNEPPEKEYLLVYDLGAGTLDITYLLIKRKSNGNLDYVQVLGRIGSRRAGNALDTTLAKLIVHRAIKDSKVTLDNQKIFTEELSDRYEQKVFFKDFIKNWLKIDLCKSKNNEKKVKKLIREFHKEQAGNLPIDEQWLGELQYKEFRENNPVINTFLYQNGEYVLEQLILNLGNSGKGIPIDTVVFSGRGSLFPGIQEKVVSYIEKHCYVDQELDRVTFPTPEEMKNAVPLGALIYAEMFREDKHKFRDKLISANYGILRRVGTKFVFDKLVGPEIEVTSEDEFPIECPPEPVEMNFENDTMVRFIQSYHSKPAEEIQKEEVQFSSKIFELPVQEVVGGYEKNKLPVQVRIEKEKYLIFKKLGVLEDHPIGRLERMNLDKDLVYEENAWPECEARLLKKQLEKMQKK